MKNLLSYLLLTVSLTTGFTQQLETDLLPDSLEMVSSKPYTSDGEVIHAIVRSINPYTPYYLKIEDGNYEFISNVPYELGPNKTSGMEIYDHDVYHLTRYKGVRIYKQNGTWDSLTVNNGLRKGWVQGLLKDNDKLYVITKDSLNYFDGTSWNYYFLDSGSKYAKMVKNDNKIYFNTYDYSGDQGIFVFDGNNLQLLIDQFAVYSFEIFENQIYLSCQSGWYNQGPFVYTLSGTEIETDFNYTFGNQRTVMCSLNDTLYCLYDKEGVCVQNNELIQIQHNLSHTYDESKKIVKYKNGVLAPSLNNTTHKLTYINISQYDPPFGTLQMNSNYKNLDINQVDAYYMNRGRMFWDGVARPAYEVPKGTGKHSTFAAGLWVSAKDESDSIHIAAVKFNSLGYDYSPGPLRATGNNKGKTDTAYATSFDYIWKISREEILLHQLRYQDNDYNIPTDIQTWPAHGNTSDGYAENLAPFIDTDDNGIYEPENGDYPDIKGDMLLYWIFNDNLSPHTESPGSVALGVEVHAQAYAYTCDTLTGQDSILNYTTFLNYRIINRSDSNYHHFSSAFWTDADLGDPLDDYVGTNVGLNSMYFYNGDDTDGTGEGNTYGVNPPAQFFTILDAPLAEENDGIDNDNDGSIDEAGEKGLLKNMMYFNNNPGVQGDPQFALDYYNYMNNIWKDGRSLTFGATGYNPDATGGVPCKYMFPGESDPWMNGTNGVDPNYIPQLGWTEENEGNPPDDRRGIATSGSFDFNSGDELEFTMAMVFSRGEDGAFSSVTKGFTDVARIIEMYNNGELHGCGLENVSVKEINEIRNIEIYPNPVKTQFIIKGADINSKYQIIDVKGQLVRQGKSLKTPISIKGLDSGTYIVRLISKQSVSSQKLIIE